MLLGWVFRERYGDPRELKEARRGRTENRNLRFSRLILSSSTIDKMFEIFGPIFEQNANINFEPIFEKSVNFGPIFEKNANFGRIFEKSVNFEHFVNGK